jgi:Glycosyl transferase family 2
VDISLIASSVRPHLWKEFLDSLTPNKCRYEIVFSGNLSVEDIKPFLNEYACLKYIHTGNIKPAQCYEVARRIAQGNIIMWVADDCEFSENLLDDIVKLMETMPKRTLLSVRTNENNTLNDLNDHRFFGWNVNTPLMAPLGCIKRSYLIDLGGFDRRYICGQYENDVAMRVWADGGSVIKYENGCVNIEHLRKHGPSTKFWSGYDHDRKILEDTWVIGGYKPVPAKMLVLQDLQWGYYTPLDNREVLKHPQLKFEPYEKNDILMKSQSHKGQWD